MGRLGRLKEIRGIRGAIYRCAQLQARTTFALRTAADFAALRMERNDRKPCITAVVVGRNDDYMSDFKQRLRATIEWNVCYLIGEVIFVEWNPPVDRELLSIALTKRFKCLRAFAVSPEVHQAICENAHLPLLEFHAKNVGIRRARSEWVVATIADTAFGPDTVRRILQTKLSDDIVWSAQHITIVWREGRESGINLLDCLRYRRIIPYHPLGTGEFAFASKRLWERARNRDCRQSTLTWRRFFALLAHYQETMIRILLAVARMINVAEVI
jgi:hypothetical protein